MRAWLEDSFPFVAMIALGVSLATFLGCIMPDEFHFGADRTLGGGGGTFLSSVNATQEGGYNDDAVETTSNTVGSLRDNTATTIGGKFVWYLGDYRIERVPYFTYPRSFSEPGIVGDLDLTPSPEGSENTRGTDPPGKSGDGFDMTLLWVALIGLIGTLSAFFKTKVAQMARHMIPKKVVDAAVPPS